MVGKHFWSNGCETQEALLSLKLSRAELPGRTNISLIRAMVAAVNDPLVIADSNLRLRLVQFLEDLLTVRAALTSLATADKLEHLREVVIPRLCHPDTISVLGPFDNPAEASGAAADEEPLAGKHFGFSKFHIYVLELNRAVARWGCATNVGMSGFEAANKDIVTIARHCLAARGDFLWRLAQLATVRYFFRFSLDTLLDPAAAPLPYEPSVRPQNALATFPRKQGAVDESEPLFKLLVRALEETYGVSNLSAHRMARSTGITLALSSFIRVENGVYINKMPLRAGDFAVVKGEGGALVLVQLCAFAAAPDGSGGGGGGGGGAPLAHKGFYFGYSFAPLGADARHWAWDGEARRVGQLADVFGRALTFPHPHDPAIRCFSPSTCRFAYV